MKDDVGITSMEFSMCLFWLRYHLKFLERRIANDHETDYHGITSLAIQDSETFNNYIINTCF